MSRKITHTNLVKLLKWIEKTDKKMSKIIIDKLMNYNKLNTEEKMIKKNETIDFINQKLKEIHQKCLDNTCTVPELSDTEEKHLIENIDGIKENELSELDSFKFDSELFKGGKRKNKKTNKKRRKGGTKKRSNKNMNK